MIKYILQLEGAAFFLTSLYFYQILHGNWLLFIVLLFTPDISMVGYVLNKKVGALMYNLVHNYILGLAVIFLGHIILSNNTLTLLGIILFAHIALDRFCSFGLKYPTAFKHTHLQRV